MTNQTTQENGVVASQQIPQVITPTHYTVKSITNISTVEIALSHIDSTDRKTWIDCGMAIKSEFGDAGFDTWDRWSASADNYNARDAIACWKSFKNGGGITISTLFKHAKDNGFRHIYCEKPTALSQAEIALREARNQANLEVIALKRAAAAKMAHEIWNTPLTDDKAPPNVIEHEYIKRKGINPHGIKIYQGNLNIGEMDCNGALMIPMKLGGKISSLQFINVAGEKRFLPNGEKGGYMLGKIETGKPVCICEGFATASTIYKATGNPTIAAFDAGNLKKIAHAIRTNKPDLEIVLCADIDESGIGQRKASEAAQSVSGLVAIPNFSEPRLNGESDFNDMASLLGLEDVQRAIANANTPIVVENIIQLNHENGSLLSDEWPAPQPFTTKLEIEPYPIESLPEAIRAAVEEVRDFVKAPTPLVALSAITALSLSIQGHFDVERAKGLNSPVSIFILGIASSGERKTTCDGFFCKPIREYERKQLEAAKPILKNYEAALAAWKAKYNGVLDKINQLKKVNKSTESLELDLCELQHNEPERPLVTRLLYGDITPEELAYKLANVWPSGGLVSSEAGVVFGSAGMSGESVTRNLSRLNVLWDGGELPVDRRSSESFVVRSARLTVSLQIQCETLLSFLGKSGELARGSGFLARFLLTHPESTQGFRIFTESPDDWPYLDAFNLRIAELLNMPLPMDEDGVLTPQMLFLTPEAKAEWVNYYNKVEAELAIGGKFFTVRDVASKSADNAMRIAALFHIFGGGQGEIGLEVFNQASRIAEWHLYESLRFFSEQTIPVELEKAAKLDKWLIGYCKREHTSYVAKRYVRQNGTIRNGQQLDTAISELTLLNRIQLREDGKQLSIWLNPKLLSDDT
jgi:putative DNA primase/helicase